MKLASRTLFRFEYAAPIVILLLLVGSWLLHLTPQQPQWHLLAQAQGQGSGLVGQVPPQQGELRIQWQCQQAGILWLLLDSEGEQAAHYQEPCSPKSTTLLVTLPGTVYLAAEGESPWTVQVARSAS